MSKGQKIGIAVIVLLMIVIAANAMCLPSGSLPDSKTATRSTSAAAPAKTADELVAAMERNLAQLFPDRYKLDYDADARRVNIGIYMAEEDYWDIYANVTETGDRTSWDKLLNSTVEADRSWRQTFAANGQGDIFLVWSWLRSRTQTTNLIVATVANGEIVQDYFGTLSQQTVQETDGYYVLNQSSMIFHRPACEWVGEMDPANRYDFHGDRNDIIAQGYRACMVCNP